MLTPRLFQVNFTHPLLMGKEDELVEVQNMFSKSVRGSLPSNLKLMLVGNLGIDYL